MSIFLRRNQMRSRPDTVVSPTRILSKIAAGDIHSEAGEMQVQFLKTSGISAQLLRLMENYAEFYWAVAWGSDGEMADRLLAHREKICQIVVGTHFCQTDPNLLERLQGCRGARVVPQSGPGTFHPKVFGFASGNARAAIIGSANFTNAGFGDNVEAALCIEGNTGDPPLDHAMSFVDSLWRKWQTKGEITDEFLEAYRRQYESTALLRVTLQKPPLVPQRRNAAPEHDLLNMDWSGYQTAIQGAPNARTIPTRLGILRQTRTLLDGKAFSELDTIERRAIAGMVDEEQAGVVPSLARLDWKLFGSMLGAGELQKRINANNPHISTALEHIPPQGEVTKDQFDLYCEEFQRAFQDAERQPRVASITRLPALKRPDYFVCVNDENRKGFGHDIGFPPSTLRIDRYWNEVVEPLIQTSWWRMARPPGPSGRLWDGRVAMLDVLYYAD
ncbi:phospholipase D family protein [Reyranella soli]|uniref:Phospholipase D-like domain-containing protein n=1 Tax=Reyranella soli TaxID=1230389 RepID=A0A512NL32_9HYPH|nr:phospholipase D family protein [Reyranella soli]GEP59661.1 hypothetical protein RSO01_68270 [Reyranella soli]